MMKRTLDRYMMATKAFTKAGHEISSDAPDLCYVYAEDADSYYGQWVTGFGFFDVKYPKATTRTLTAAEVEAYEGKLIQVASHPPQKLSVRGKTD